MRVSGEYVASQGQSTRTCKHTVRVAVSVRRIERDGDVTEAPFTLAMLLEMPAVAAPPFTLLRMTPYWPLLYPLTRSMTIAAVAVPQPPFCLASC